MKKKTNLDLIGPDRLNYKLSQLGRLGRVCLCVWLKSSVSNHILTHQTKQGLYFPAVETVYWSSWWVARQRLGGHGVFCLHSSPLCCSQHGDGTDWRGGALFCGAWTRGMGFISWAQLPVCRPCFMPTDAHSSWRGLLVTCSSLEQHWGRFAVRG